MISQKYNRIAALFMTFLLVFSLISPGITYANDDVSDGHVVVSVEKFTLGQGYFKEPIVVPFKEGDNAAKLVADVLGEGNYKHTGQIDSAFYLSKIYDPNPGEVYIPDYIIEQAGSIGGRNDGDWLGEFDYTGMSGWMYAVNNEFPNVGFSDWKVEDGDVIRVQFTVYGFGSDIGGGFGDGSGDVKVANKDALTAKIAEINSASNKEDYLSVSEVKEAYDDAYQLLTNMESSQADIDAQLNILIDALSNNDGDHGDNNEGDEAAVNKLELETAIEKAEALKKSIEVSADGSDIAESAYWVTEEAMNQLTEKMIAGQKLLADETAIQEEIDAVVIALNEQIDSINTNKKLGNKKVGNTTFTIPKDAELFVGFKGLHFTPFTEVNPLADPIIEGNTKQYHFDLKENNEYNYRVSQPGKVTNTGTFKANSANAALEITEQQLNIVSPKAILNRGTYLEGNLFLNINEQNHLKLAKAGDSFKLLTIRNWQALIEGIANYYFEPDFNFEIITGNDVIDITPGKPGQYSSIQAKKDGTAIVKVTYDALKVNGSAYINDENDAFSAIWPENVGLFVVTVGQEETGIDTGIESNKEHNMKANEGKTGNSVMNLQNGVFDAEIDSVYYIESEEGASYTFTPTAGSEVTVLRPEINHSQGTVTYGNGTFSADGVTKNDDDSFTILLKEGRNIVKVEKAGKAEYHVMTARPLTIKTENITNPNHPFAAGDEVEVTFEGLSFPANKLAGIYNFNAQLSFLGGEENTEIKGAKRQYNIATAANSVKFKIPETAENSYTLRDGHIILGFYGSPMGAHRNIDPDNGASPNFTALERRGHFSIIPEINVPLGEAEEEGITYKEQLNRNLAYLVETVKNPTFSTLAGEWTILSLVQAGYNVPADYYDIYYGNVVKAVQAQMKDGKLDQRKSTEHSRAILGLTAIGKDITDVGGHNIVEALADFSYLPLQGINGPIFALLAFDSHHYDIPVVEGITEQTTREKLIAYILDKEIEKGGWALGGNNPDPDMTAMALQALAPYYEEDVKVKAAVDRALNWLSAAQANDGGYSSWGTANSESVAQIIIALTAIGVDPHTDERFIKDGHSALDNLLSYSVPEGGFKHILNGNVDGMATDQGTLALVAYDRFIEGKGRLYDMTDRQIEEETPDEIEQLPIPEDGSIQVPEEDHEYKIIVPESHKEAIQIDIPAGNDGKTSIELQAGVELPKITAKRGNIAVVFPETIKIKGENETLIQLLTQIDKADQQLEALLKKLIPSNEELVQIVEATTVGGNDKVEFEDGFVELTFAGMAGKNIAYIDETGQAYSIQKFSSKQEGLASGKHEYAYENGQDLIVATDHFTDFIVYTTKKQNNGGGGGPVPSVQTVTLSIDKLTINKGYVLRPTEVEFTQGETVWDVLERELRERGISYSASNSSQYGSVYVESIDGDGEFDHGSGSGWMYNVNGTYPNYGASKYTLKAGDTIQWRFTKDLGIDLGEDPSKWDDPPAGGGGGPIAPPVLEEVELEYVSSGNTPVIQVPADASKHYTIRLTRELKNKDKITIQIPNKSMKVTLDLDELKNQTPNIEVKKGNDTFIIHEGTKLSSSESSFDVFVDKKADEKKIKTLIESTLKNRKVIFDKAIAFENSKKSIAFDQQATVTFAGKKDQEVGFIDSKGKWLPIEVYQSEAEADQAQKGKTMTASAYISGNDLIVKASELATVVLYTTKESTPAIDLNAVYSDVKQISPWAYDHIKEATALKFIEGNAGKVNPKANITRAEFAKLMVSVLNLELATDQVNQFTDVKKDAWYFPYINTAYKEEIVLGYNNKFAPNDLITREEMATMIARALHLEKATTNVVYTDAKDISSWAKEYVETITALDLMEGNGKQFKPQDHATREMAIVVAMRAYEMNK